MSPTLFMARHGNTFTSEQTPIQIGSRHDLPLTTKGQEQAHQLGEYLKTHVPSIQNIFHGYLQRQYETAIIVQGYLSHAKLTPTEALNEIDYGLWEGLTQEKIVEYWSQEYDEWGSQLIWPSHIFDSNYKSHIDKLAKWIETIQTETQPVLAISSQGLIKLLLHLNTQIKQSIQTHKKGLDYKIKTGHFCELQLNNNDVFNITRWNQSPKSD